MYQYLLEPSYNVLPFQAAPVADPMKGSCPPSEPLWEDWQTMDQELPLM